VNKFTLPIRWSSFFQGIAAATLINLASYSMPYPPSWDLIKILPDD
jgi:hypothetical protein